MSRHHHRLEPPPDPAPDYTEWIQHRYDPGYWLGGRVPPFLKRRRVRSSRGNPFGVLLLLSALSALIAEGTYVLGLPRWMQLPIAAVVLAAVLLYAIAGIRLLRGPEGNPEEPSNNDEPRSLWRHRR